MTDLARLGFDVDSSDLARGEVALESFAREAQRTETTTTRAATRVSADMRRISTSTRRGFGALRGNLQAFGLQSQDIIVQAQQGVRESVILAQQVPQLLGQIGGATGALVGLGVAAGAIAFAPLIDGLFDTADEAKSAEDAVDDLLDTFSRIQDSVDTAITPIQDLREEFGRFAQQVRDDALFFAQLELDSLGSAVGDAVEGVREPLDRFQRLTGELRDAQDFLARVQDQQSQGFADSNQVALARVNVESLQDSILQVADGFGVSRDELALLIADFDRLAAAEGPEAIADAAQQIIDNFQILRTTNGEINSDFQDIASAAGDVRDAAARIVTILGDASDAASDAGESMGGAADQGSLLAALSFGNIDAAATAAGQLAERLGISVAAASRLSEIQQRGGAFRGRGADGEVVFDPRDPRFDPLVAGQAQASEVRASSGSNPFAPPRRSGGGGGGGGGAQEVAAEVRAAETIIRRAQQAALDYAEVAAVLDQRLADGAITQEVYNEAIEQAREAYSGAGDAAQFFQDEAQSLKDGLLDSIAPGESLADTFDGIRQSIARAALEAALFGEGPFAGSNSGSGLLGNLFGGIFGGFRAGGGPVEAGRAYVVGERRPEMFVPNQSGTILPSVPGSGGIQVNVHNYSGQQVAQRQSTGPDGRQVLDIAIGESITSGRQDGSLGGRFGAQPNRRLRG